MGSAAFAGYQAGISTCNELSIWMHPTDQKVLSEIVLALDEVDNTHYLEWGTGGSTRFVAKYLRGANEEAVGYSIEHYPPWCAKMQQDPLVVRAVELGNLYETI